jgi:Na+/proline symporter
MPVVVPGLLWYVVGYIALMVVLGIVWSQAVHNADDFVLAGRSLGSVVLMGTMLATWCGSGTVTGGGASIGYSNGIWPAIFYNVASVTGIAVLFTLSGKIRALSKRTIPEILEEKYGPWARGLGTIIVLLAYVGIISYQFTGLGYVLNVTTGLPVVWGTLIGLFIMTFLATMGGLKSVAPTDAVSAVIMLSALVIAVPVSIAKAGGWSQVVAKVPASHFAPLGGLSVVALIGFFLPTLFLLLGDQNMYQRIAAGVGDKETRTAIKGWFVGLVIVMFSIPIIATVSRSIFPDIKPGMSLIAVTTVLPNVIGGILLTSIAACIVTTGDSFILSSATNFTYDFWNRYINHGMSDKNKFLLTKVMCVVLALFAYMMVNWFPSILTAQMYAYTVYGAGITPALLGGILWKRANKWGGLSSMVVGMVVTLVWELVLHKPFGIASAVISIPVAIVVFIVVCLATPKPVAAALKPAV